jgi:hypothetical protein
MPGVEEAPLTSQSTLERAGNGGAGGGGQHKQKRNSLPDGDNIRRRTCTSEPQGKIVLLRCNKYVGPFLLSEYP